MEFTSEELDSDVLIVGTGLAESIISASLALNKLSVFNIEVDEYYGNTMRSLNGRALLEFVEETVDTDSASISIFPSFNTAKDGVYVNRKLEFSPYDTSVSDAYREKLAARPNNYNVDLMPRGLLARSEIVSTMQMNGTGRYLEFTGLSISAALEPSPSSPESLQSVRVPLTKGDIFKDKFLTMLEKRHLMKFITNFARPSRAFVTPKVFEQRAMHLVEKEEQQAALARENTGEVTAKAESDDQLQLGEAVGDLDGDWIEFLTKQSLSPRLQAYLCYGVCLAARPVVRKGEEQSSSGASCSWTVREGLRRVQQFVTSLGIFGDTYPILFPLYGAGDLPQAFTRLAAVQGAKFALRMAPTALVVDSATDTVRGVRLANDQVVNCKQVIIGEEMVPEACRVAARRLRLFARGEYAQDAGVGEVHLVMLANQKLLASDKDGFAISFAYPPSVRSPVHIVQMDSSSYCCPQNTFLVHFQTTFAESEGPEAADCALNDLKKLATSLVTPLLTPSSDDTSPSAPVVEWQLSYVRKSLVPASIATRDAAFEEQVALWSKALSSNFLTLIPLPAIDPPFQVFSELRTAQRVFGSIDPKTQFGKTHYIPAEGDAKNDDHDGDDESDEDIEEDEDDEEEDGCPSTAKPHVWTFMPEPSWVRKERLQEKRQRSIAARLSRATQEAAKAPEAVEGAEETQDV